MSDDRLLLYIEFGMGWAGVDGLLYVLTGLIRLAVNRAGPGRHYVPHHRPEHGMRNKPYWPGQDVDRVVSCRAVLGPGQNFGMRTGPRATDLMVIYIDMYAGCLGPF